MIKGFTKQDISLLLEAIETWERADTGPPMMVHIMASIIGTHDPEAQQRLDNEIQRRQSASDADRCLRKERGVMLRAKLITLRDSADADEFMKSI